MLTPKAQHKRIQILPELSNQSEGNEEGADMKHFFLRKRVGREV